MPVESRTSRNLSRSSWRTSRTLCARGAPGRGVAELGTSRTVRARNWAESRTGGSVQEEALVTISASDGMIQVGVFQILEPREGTIDLRPFGRDELGGCSNGCV